MISDFFISRPIFATVSAVIFVLMGLVVLPFLPVQQYPDISPTKVTVVASYNGANAETVESAVTVPLEQEINGVEGMRSISSSSTNDGRSTIVVTFKAGREPDVAVADVKNRVDIATGRLPQEVKLTGVIVKKNSDSIVLGTAFFSPDGSRDAKFVSNFIDRNVLERLRRLPGVGDVGIFGERKFAMRLWLDPLKLAARNLSVQDVVTALQQQNISVPGGQIGKAPLDHEQLYQYPVVVQGRLSTEEEFGNLALRSAPNGSAVLLKDVGRIELGAEAYNTGIRWKGYDSVGFRVDQLPDANALDVSRVVQDELLKMKKTFPKGLTYQVGFNPTSFISEAIKEVQHTLFEAIAFVVLVIFIFLQNWRTTIIPAITIPVSLIGTLFFFKLFGFSINMLTLFGLILATGIVVDDAIVVIENMVRQMEEDPTLTGIQAARKGMREVYGALVATALVLVAVFTPVAFFPGTTGILYQQFALTIAVAVVISAINALTFTPAIASRLLKAGHAEHKGIAEKVFTPVNWFLDLIDKFYAKAIVFVIRWRAWVLGLFLVLISFTVMLFAIVPKGFIPTEDQGYFIIAAQAPEGTSYDYMTKIIKRVEKIIKPIEEVNGIFAVNGFGFNGNAPNKAIMFVPLKSIEERHGAEHSASNIIGRIRMKLLAIPEAFVIPFDPPAVRGLGSLGGFQFQLQDREGLAGLQGLEGAQWELMGKASQEPSLTGMLATFTTDSPLLRVTVDRERAVSLGIPVSEVFNTIQVLLGSLYVNDFNLANRAYRVYVQADSQFRDNPAVLKQFFVRNTLGQMLPLSTVMHAEEGTGPTTINHFNLYRSTEVSGSTAPGFSSGQSLETMEKLASQLSLPGMGFEWSGLALEQLESGGQANLFLLLGVIFVFLVLAAQYESYLDPFIILLSVPLAMLGALLAVQARGLDNNIFTQIGMVLLIGLASKNAILIVEFANQLRAKGLPLLKAAIQASLLRFRPILMTSLAFIFGVLPLVFASGAGAAARQAMGTAVFGGMLVSTTLSLFIVPVLYVVLKSAVEVFKPYRLPEHLQE